MTEFWETDYHMNKTYVYIISTKMYNIAIRFQFSVVALIGPAFTEKQTD